MRDSLRRVDQTGILAGLVFIGIGVLGLVAAQGLSIGTLASMGPGFMPRILSILICIVGAVTIVRAFLVRQPIVLPTAAPRAVICILLAVAGFALINAVIGYLAAAFFLIVVASLARPGHRWPETLLLAAVMGAVTTGIFIYGLGVQLRLF